MREERTRQDSDDSSLDEEYELPEGSSVRMKVALILFVLIAAVGVGYGWLQHRNARQMSAAQADLRASLTQAKTETDSLTAKVNALTAAQAQEEAARVQAEAAKAEAAKTEQPAPRVSAPPRRPKRVANAHAAASEDPRWKLFQDLLGAQQRQLEDDQKQIANTQANLEQAKAELAGSIQSARTDLGGDIARNHTELVALQRKGERNYYEFSFEKSKTYHHAGPVSIALRKADSKHDYCDLDLIIDDKPITRKHVDLYESISLYPQGFPMPLEVVINHIGKDSVQGYVSEPKFRTPEEAATPAPAPTAAAAASPSPTTSDAKLVHRDDGGH